MKKSIVYDNYGIMLGRIEVRGSETFVYDKNGVYQGMTSNGNTYNENGVLVTIGEAPGILLKSNKEERNMLVNELPIEKSKKPTRSAEKKAGRYIGFQKLVSKLKNKKGIQEQSLEKSINDLTVDDFMQVMFEENYDGVIMNAPEQISEFGKAQVKDPAALAAYIGRKKYGKEKYTKMSAEGKKKSIEPNPESDTADIKDMTAKPVTNADLVETAKKVPVKDPKMTE